MAWIDIQKKGYKEIYRVTTEAYEQTFKEQGFVIVENAQNSVSTAQSAEVDKSIKPTPKTPVKRQYTRHTANGDK